LCGAITANHLDLLDKSYNKENISEASPTRWRAKEQMTRSYSFGGRVAAVEVEVKVEFAP
jgi:hypothetical protein